MHPYNLEIELHCAQSPRPFECELIYEPTCEPPEGPEDHSGAYTPPACSPFVNKGYPTHDVEFSYLLWRLGKMDYIERMNCVSKSLQGSEFVADPLGEGDAGLVDPDPLYDLEAHDCMTYVEHVMALSAGSESFSGFLSELNDIRYYSGMNAFGFRKHFVSADWIPSNASEGRIRDITHNIGEELTESMSIVIDRAGWVLNRNDLSFFQKTSALADLEEIDKDMPEEVTVDYIPISAFFTRRGGRVRPREGIIDELPEVSIALMVRKYESASSIGVMIAHMGLLIVPELEDGSRGRPIYSHSSQRCGMVTEEPFLPYILSQEAWRAGVVILEILERNDQYFI